MLETQKRRRKGGKQSFRKIGNKIGVSGENQHIIIRKYILYIPGHRSSKASYTPPLLLDSLVPMELEVGSPGSLQVVSILNDTTQNLVIDGLDDAEELVETEQMIHDQGDKLNSQTGDLEAIPEPEQNIVLCKLDNNSIRAPKNDPFLS